MSAEMTFRENIEDLRTRILRIVIATQFSPFFYKL